jgi:hypothetical protein
MASFQPLIQLKLSIQQALVGEITANLVSVTCSLRDQQIIIKAYFSGPVTEADVDRIQCVGTEVIADFPEGYMVDERYASIDVESEEMLDFWAFRRAN